MFMRYAVLTAVSIVMFMPVKTTAQYGQYSSRGLLEKKIYYADESGKVGMCSFWSLHLGKHSCKLTKTFPGEGNVSIDAEVNFNFLSSLYIEGKGYSSRGKVDAEAKFAVLEPEGGLKVIEPEQIESVSEYGNKIKTTGMETTALILLSQENRLTVNHMLIRIFVMDKETKDLKADKDVVIKAFAFSKEELAKALQVK
jgi:hypothetical protein